MKNSPNTPLLLKTMRTATAQVRFKKSHTTLRKELRRAEKQLTNAEKAINYHFTRSHKEYINEEIFPRAAKVANSTFTGKTRTKKFTRRFRSFKVMSAYQLFLLELDCLGRINEQMLLQDEENHFPILVDYNPEKATITTSHNGISLDKLTTKMVVPNLERQITTILNILANARVIHLDMHKRGSNIVIDSHGILSIIDFDMAQAANRPFNYTVEAKLRRGKQLLTRKQIEKTLACNSHIIIQ
ncbi:hypothetical protein [Chitinivibrio alkaliphilus]|uniref:Protein kinase domain-containing protein n=1 Tax=Chitinivibrio alkaliphilus ACht1 TaxID=1313304 RepID=U7D389_9BACT|nr:hypothetical protein [Chitinivibrio alkaliphilus]ERP30969.1 hypothetical protein CALK_2164 [Chitinivibrio alkaliphilus ACht1]